MLKKFSRWNKSVPHYKELQEMVTEAIQKDKDEVFDVLELGTGKGGTAISLFEKFSNISYEGVDYDEPSIVFAKKKLRKFKNVVLNVSRFMPFVPQKGKYDVVVAVLALHHLTNDEKVLILKKIRTWLKDGGTLVIGDLVRLNDEKMQAKAVKVFSDYRENNLSAEEFEAAKEHLRTEPHIINTFDETKSFLTQAGFNTVDIIWCYYRCAVIRAK